MKKNLRSICAALSIVIAAAFAVNYWLNFSNVESEKLQQNSLVSATENVQNVNTANLDLTNLPLSFEINRGQAEPEVKFIAKNAGRALFLSPHKASIALSKPPIEKGAPDATAKSRADVLQIELLGANSQASAEGVERLAATSNYFVGDDANRWQSGVEHFAKARFAEVYPGVDVVYYGNQQKLEYDFLVKPGASFEPIALKFEGADAIAIDDTGALVARVGSTEVRQHAPIVYQEIAGEKRAVDGKFVLKNESEVRFEIGEYDVRETLVIDPILVYSTYLGGSQGGLFNSEQGNRILVDAVGNVYVAGFTPSSDFPTRPGAFQAALGGANDCFISKLNQTGTALIFSTYLGGADSDVCTGLALDQEGNVLVSGQTLSNNFPILNPFQNINRGNGDAFITKLNPTGSALVFSTYLGGTVSEFAANVRVDAAGNIYTGGGTNSTDFPVVNAFQANNAGGIDGFFAKFNPTGNALVFSTYYGGSFDDTGQGFTTDNQNNSYLTGVTNSRDLPVSANAFQRVKSGSDDAFVVKLNASGARVYATYVGGNGIDNANDVAADLQGNAAITGFTRSLNLPRRNAFQPTRAGGVDGFVTKLNASGTGLVFSTFLGGSELENGFGVAFDFDGNLYATGRSNSGDFPLKKPLQDFAGLDDIYVVKFTPEGGLVFSTPLGGDTNDVGTKIAADSQGNVYVTGTADFGLITTPGALQTQPRGGADAFIAKINTLTRNVRADFDGDRRTDIAVFRPSNGTWYILQSSNNQFRSVTFGAAGDRPVPGDYDADGRTDIAVFRPSNSTWYWLRSSDNGFASVAWGTTGDRPVQGDYDADGITDAAVYRPSLGAWFVLRSGDNNLQVQQLGSPADRPVQADYDADEQTDFAIFQTSNNVWTILQSFVGLRNQQFGLNTDATVPADYDGDGKDDIAVFRPSNGTWYVLRSGDNQVVSEAFGANGDVPSPGDYDGDRRTDFAVFRAGTWYIRQSSNGALRSVQFGAAEDIPIPSAYVPQ